MGNKADLILNYMTDFIKENGYPPTVREICAELDIKSTSTVHRYLKELQAEGRISMGENQNRAISIKNTTPPGTIPVLGHVAAGSPILAEEEVDEYIDPLTEAFLENEDYEIGRASCRERVSPRV